MTKVSRIKVDSQHLGYFLNNFWTTLTLLENKDQVANFLKDILTHTEMKMIAKRIQIAKMLLEGYSYQAIKNYVKVTDATISKISNILETRGEGLKIAIEHLKNIEKETEKNRMRSNQDLKRKYGIYFSPDKIIDSLEKGIKTKRKKKSVVKRNDTL